MNIVSKEIKTYFDKVNKILSEVEKVRPDKHLTLYWVDYYWKQEILQLIEYELELEICESLKNGIKLNTILKKIEQSKDIIIKVFSDESNIRIFITDESNSIRHVIDFNKEDLNSDEDAIWMLHNNKEYFTYNIKNIPDAETIIKIIDEAESEDYELTSIQLINRFHLKRKK